MHLTKKIRHRTLEHSSSCVLKLQNIHDPCVDGSISLIIQGPKLADPECRSTSLRHFSWCEFARPSCKSLGRYPAQRRRIPEASTSRRNGARRALSDPTECTSRVNTCRRLPSGTWPVGHASGQERHMFLDFVAFRPVLRTSPNKSPSQTNGILPKDPL